MPTSAATVYIWRIVKLEHEAGQESVFTAHYTVAINDGTFAVGTYGDVALTLPETTAFGNLTQEQVIGLVKDELGTEKVAEIEAGLDARMISEQQPQTQVVRVPWEEAPEGSGTADIKAQRKGPRAK